MVATMTTAYADGTFATKIRTYTGAVGARHRRRRDHPVRPGPGQRLLPSRQPALREPLATIVTTNRGLPDWAELFGGDSVVAAAILDRLLDRAAVINIKGPSWRLREHQALVELGNVTGGGAKDLTQEPQNSAHTEPR